MQRKDKIIATLLAFFLGGFGIHRFYLGQVGLGIVYLIFCWTFIPAVIAFIDFIGILVMSNEDFDRKYNTHLFQRRSFGYQTPPQNIVNQPYINTPNHNYRQQPQMQNRVSYHGQILKKVNDLRDEIINKIENSSDFSNDIVQDIKPLVDKYITQVRELVERDKRLESVAQAHSINDIDLKVTELTRKLNNPMSDSLKHEYEKSISRHLRHRQAIQEFKEQREKIKLRLDSTVMSLEEIRFNLIRMETLAAEEQRNEFFKMFEEKSNDLSTYLTFLKQHYDENTID